MIDVYVKYVSYYCGMDGGECFPGKCDDPYDASAWCPEYTDTIYDPKGKVKRIECICIGASPRENIIAKKCSSVEYKEHEYLKFGNMLIESDSIIELSINGRDVIKVDTQ